MVVDSLVETLGPFLIPIVIFLLGVVGYGLLRALTRSGLLPLDGGEDHATGESDEKRD